MASPIFDCLIIGKGLMGSAAARYLAQAGARVAVIGPDEPADPARHQGVFASHYDQGRITRILSKDATWAALAQRAIGQYAYLEEASGIPFYTPSGGLYVGRKGQAESTIAQVPAIGQAFAVDYAQLDPAELASRFPFLRFPATCQGIYEPPPAGHINPRRLIQAQLALATAAGAAIIRETAHRVRRVRRIMQVTTDAGASYRGEKVLVAAGAFSNCFDLLPRPLPLRIKSETIILARLEAAEAARLAGMPTLIYDIDSPSLSDIYLLPPILYPDGYPALKMGCNTTADRWLPDFAALHGWFVAGDSDGVKEAMQEALESLIPGLKALAWETKRCAITYTPSGKPIIAALDEGLYVATGGNGSAAKSSDTIGWLAALKVLGEEERGWGEGQKPNFAGKFDF